MVNRIDERANKRTKLKNKQNNIRNKSLKNRDAYSPKSTCFAKG